MSVIVIISTLTAGRGVVVRLDLLGREISQVEDPCDCRRDRCRGGCREDSTIRE